ncbi:MAG: hypothetical protein ACRDRK_24140 [Pseudonocardia sp.]
MGSTEPTTELDPRYGEPEAVATEWADASKHLTSAEVAWLSMVRAGRETARHPAADHLEGRRAVRLYRRRWAQGAQPRREPRSPPAATRCTAALTSSSRGGLCE